MIDMFLTLFMIDLDFAESINDNDTLYFFR